MSSVYERFITANHALFACYEATPLEAFEAMNKKEQDSLCQSEQKAVAQFMKEDSINFKSLIHARLASMEQQ